MLGIIKRDLKRMGDPTRPGTQLTIFIANVTASSQAAAVAYDYDSYEYDPYERQRSGGQYAYASSSNASSSSAYEPYCRFMNNSVTRIR